MSDGRFDGKSNKNFGSELSIDHQCLANFCAGYGRSDSRSKCKPDSEFASKFDSKLDSNLDRKFDSRFNRKFKCEFESSRKLAKPACVSGPAGIMHSDVQMG